MAKLSHLSVLLASIGVASVVSCGSVSDRRPGVLAVQGTPEETAMLLPLVEEFQQDCLTYGAGPANCSPADNTTLVVRFHPTEKMSSNHGLRSAGYCKQTLTKNTITGEIQRAASLVVLSDAFLVLNTEALRSLIYHELGHCLLGKSDVVDEASIMHWSTAGECSGMEASWIADWETEVWQDCKARLFRIEL